MAGYQRFVAYVYEYRKGKKDGSSGYVRVEARDQNCRIEVHLRCAGLEPGSRCRVYGFVRREGLMDGILIGSCVTGQEQIECLLETDTENIGGMGKTLREIGGMLLISDAGGFWGTEWDDLPIRPENFREWKKEILESRKKLEKTGEENTGAEDQKGGSSAEVQKNRNEADKIMTVEEIQEEDVGISVSTMNPETKKGLQEDRVVSPEDELKISETGRPHPGQPHPGPGPRPPEPPRPGQPHPGLGPRPPEPPRPGQPNPGPGPRPPEPPRPGQPSPGFGPRPPRPTPGIPYDPFNDGQFTDCRKIKPSDCSALCRQNGCFCNNRFVMYGYQNFGHLLLCKNHRGQYILGVPGSYSQQERFMANMFGFPYFRESSEIHIPGGKGGYWYCFINI